MNFQGQNPANEDENTPQKRVEKIFDQVGKLNMHFPHLFDSRITIVFVLPFPLALTCSEILGDSPKPKVIHGTN